MGTPLLNKNATVGCYHQGTMTPLTYSRVKLSGAEVVIDNHSPLTISGCTLPKNVPPGPCQIATWASAAKRVKANQMAVVLAPPPPTPVTPPNPPGIAKVINTQARVKGI